MIEHDRFNCADADAASSSKATILVHHYHIYKFVQTPSVLQVELSTIASIIILSALSAIILSGSDMERSDDSYYEANAADISLEGITSSEQNKQILGCLRDDKLSQLRLGRDRSFLQFRMDKGDDFGWLGYFIGKSVKLQSLDIQYLPEDDGGEQQMHAFSDGIARNQSIQKVVIDNVSNNGFAAIARALGNLSQLEELVLKTDYNAGLNINRCSALGNLLELGDWKLKKLRLDSNGIDDAGVVTFASGLRSIGPSLKQLGMSHNSIRNEGLSALVDALTKDTVNGGAEVLARGLIGNKVLRRLHLRIEGQDDIEISPAGWSAFSTALCDTSTINNTYLSSHIIQELYYWDNYDYDSDNEEGFNLDGDERVVQYLQLNKEHPEHAARCKILMNHTHLDMTPLLQWELKCLPLVVGWFEKAQPCTALSIDELGPDYEGQVLEESEEAFQSRVLTALFEFVRGMPKKVLERRDELALVAAYDEKIAMVEEESDRKITQLEDENKRLRGIMKSMRNALDKALEE